MYMCILPTSRLIANLGQLVTWCLNLGYQVKIIGKPPYTHTHIIYTPDTKLLFVFYEI